jgi:thiamine pyrophosphate-dependent acetolactate synthase large subunit-like protein
MSQTRLDRRAVVASVLAGRTDLLVVTGLGSPTYDVAACGDHDRNFYLWGAMGGAAVMGLGLALARPDVPVLVVTGDGEMLMGVGGFATIAAQAPGNLSVLVLDNGLYGETGGQKSHTSLGADLAGMAAGAGLADARTLTTGDEVAAFGDRARRIGNVPCIGVAKVMADEQPRVLPTRDGAYLRGRFRVALGLPPM